MLTRKTVGTAALAGAMAFSSCSHPPAPVGSPDAESGQPQGQQASFIVEVTPAAIRPRRQTRGPSRKRSSPGFGGRRRKVQWQRLQRRQYRSARARARGLGRERSSGSGHRRTVDVLQHRDERHVHGRCIRAPFRARGRRGSRPRSRARGIESARSSVILPTPAGTNTRLAPVSNGIDVMTTAGHFSRGCLQLGEGTTVPKVDRADDLCALVDCLVRLKAATGDGTQANAVYIVAPPVAKAASVVASRNRWSALSPRP